MCPRPPSVRENENCWSEETWLDDTGYKKGGSDPSFLNECIPIISPVTRMENSPTPSAVNNVDHVMLRPLGSSDVDLNLFKSSRHFKVLLTWYLPWILGTVLLRKVSSPQRVRSLLLPRVCIRGLFLMGE